MEYRDFACLLLEANGHGLAAVLLPSYDTDQLKQSLRKATELFGQPAAACFLTVGPHRTLEAVAAHLHLDKLVVHTKPVTLLRQGRLRASSGKELDLVNKQQLLFRLPGWILRQVFGLRQYQPYPLLDATLLAKLGPGLPPEMGHRHAQPLVAAVHRLEAIVHLAASQDPLLDILDAGTVDYLHCLGVVYVLVIDEFVSPAETKHIDAALACLLPHGFTHLWWLEDVTFAKRHAYHLVVRANDAATGQPRSMKRRVLVQEDSRRLLDLESGMASPQVDFHTGGILRLSSWVTCLIGGLGPGERAFPYMRREVLEHFGFARLPSRPLLVNGRPAVTGETSAALALPPRLLHSWDLMVPRSRVASNKKPCAVHMQVSLQTWGEDPDIKLYLALEGDKRHVYNLLLEGTGWVNFHMDNPAQDTLGPKDIVLAVFQHAWKPVDGSVVIEFTIVSFWQSFFLFLDSRLVDVSMWATVHAYDAAVEPVRTGRMDVPVFTTAAKVLAAKRGLTLDEAVPRALVSFQAQDRRRRDAVPIFQGKRIKGKDAYRLQHWDEHERVDMDTSSRK